MRQFSPLLLTAIFLAVIAVMVSIAPPEQVLGKHVRLVYLHGVWVWTALIGFAVSGLAGLLGLLLRRQMFQRLSVALGRTATLFWLTYLPLSLWTMQVNWNGLFLDEPRWRIGLDFAIIAILVQIAITILDNDALGGLVNLGFIAALGWSLSRAQQVMHPPSPILTADSLAIRGFFFALLLMCLLTAWQLTRFFLSYRRA